MSTKKFRIYFISLLGVCLLMGCGDSTSQPFDNQDVNSADTTSADGSQTSDTDTPACKPLFMAARDPGLYIHHENELVLLYPPPGSDLGKTDSLAISGRAFGDFSGGIEIDGVSATILGNAFHAVLPGPGEGGVALSIIARGGDGEITATLEEFFEYVETVGGPNNGISIGWHVFRPPSDPAPFFDLLEDACSDRLIFLMRHEATPLAEYQTAIKEKGLQNLGYLGKGRVVVADKADILALTPAFMEDAFILWLGPLVPEMKYHLGVFTDLFALDLGTVQLGQSIAGVPAVTFGGSDDTQSDINALIDLLEKHAVWHSSSSATFVHAITELEEMKWILQESLVQWVERIWPLCEECMGCPCDTSPCATLSPLCPALFGPDALCEDDACWIP